MTLDMSNWWANIRSKGQRSRSPGTKTKKSFSRIFIKTG